MTEQPPATGPCRVCGRCGQTAPGLFPVGWAIDQIREPVRPQGLMMMVVGERALCPACRRPELIRPPCV